MKDSDFNAFVVMHWITSYHDMTSYYFLDISKRLHAPIWEISEKLLMMVLGSQIYLMSIYSDNRLSPTT